MVQSDRYTVEQAERDLFKANPISLVRSEYLKIKTKDSKMVPLKLNSSQVKLLLAINTQRVAKQPVRIYVLKARQMGVSTEIEAIVFSDTSQRANRNAIIISSDDDGSNHLFEMSKLYHEQLEIDQPHLAPKRKYSNEKKLEFMHKHSLILIDSAQNKRAGRSYTFHLAHVSEAAFFPDFEATMLALSQAVPDLPETYMFVESTANGEDNAFARQWFKIKKAFAEGDTSWIPLFLSWKGHAEYQRAFITESERAHFQESMTTEEKKIMAAHELTLEQMNWRRRTIIDKCGGDPKKFCQEYPLTDEEAFLTTSRRVFGEEHTKPQEKNLEKNPFRGELEWVNNRPAFIASNEGDLLVYETPKKGHRYVMAVDASEGINGGDYACIQVLDRSTWTQAAIYRSQTKPDILGQKAFNLGAWFNWALAAPEINGAGLVTTLRLRDLGYPNIVHRTALAIDAGVVRESDELGWHTNSKTKPILVSDLESALREILVVVKDPQTLLEIKHFVVKDVSEAGYVTYGSAPGYHDDTVMALALAVHFAKTLPDAPGIYDSMPEVRSTRSTGY